MKELEIETYSVMVGGKWWKFTAKISQAILLNDRVLIIFDYMEYPQGCSARNLVAYDKNQNELWVAENPSSSPVDAYVNFVSSKPLKVWNFACYICTLDPQTGKLLDSQFTK